MILTVLPHKSALAHGTPEALKRLGAMIRLTILGLAEPLQHYCLLMYETHLLRKRLHLCNCLQIQKYHLEHHHLCPLLTSGLIKKILGTRAVLQFHHKCLPSGYLEADPRQGTTIRHHSHPCWIKQQLS